MLVLWKSLSFENFFIFLLKWEKRLCWSVILPFLCFLYRFRTFDCWFSLWNLIHDWACYLYSLLTWFLAFLWKFKHWVNSVRVASSKHLHTFIIIVSKIMILKWRAYSDQLKLSRWNLKLFSDWVICLIASLMSHLKRMLEILMLQ